MSNYPQLPEDAVELAQKTLNNFRHDMSRIADTPSAIIATAVPIKKAAKNGLSSLVCCCKKFFIFIGLKELFFP